jgi:putative nucleotidyltransferase with HDIG domain
VGVNSVASLPGIYLRLCDVINDPRSSAVDVGRVMAEDPGLTARLLRLVNSALYGFPSRIETVSQAISIVGTAQLSDLALATSVIRAFANMPEDLVTMESFWRHSVACGTTARVIASRRREPNVERFFVAGLLHDIGRPIIFMRAAVEERQALALAEEKTLALFEAEQQVMGFDHTHVGSALLEAWKLPLSLREAVAFHHHPERAHRFPVEAGTVHVADILANGLRLGSSGERMVPPFVPAAWDLLGLSPAIIPGILEEAERQYHAAVQVVLGDVV